MFRESGLKPHLYLWIAGVVFLILFLGYVFWFEHKENINVGDFWDLEFERSGLTKEQRNDITHDDSMWYYQRVATCVGYGDENGGPNGSPGVECPKHESFCAGNNTFGTPAQQAKAVMSAIKKGGIHEECPLIYSGTD